MNSVAKAGIMRYEYLCTQLTYLHLALFVDMDQPRRFGLCTITSRRCESWVRFVFCYFVRPINVADAIMRFLSNDSLRVVMGTYVVCSRA